ncbi:MAG: hypothetical protein HYR72_06395 [Deltaproteobacteria bacterium]|nr:hypothetical protein [Deltaproteobacteria bacterium]MBI3387075.1 hypothetical protein [Deltaproteobacteria bacterium]
MPKRWGKLKSWRCLAFALAFGFGCSRDGESVPVVAPFNAESKIGEVTAVWQNTSEERAFADGTRLPEPQVRFQYRAEVHNRLHDKVFVRLTNFQLTDTQGLALATSPATVACALAGDATVAVLAGELWVPKNGVDAVRRFSVSPFVVPLSERGRALYREWLLQGRTDKAAAVDAEIAGYAAAPACVPQ